MPGYEVSIETSGALDISAVDPRVSRVLDLKTPGSKESHRNLYENIALLTANDQVKFVICSRDDYDWAVSKLIEYGLERRAGEVLFSPSHHDLSARDLADWIVADNLPVRLQMQLHKYFGMTSRGAEMTEQSVVREKRAVILLSGGLDSATVVAMVRAEGYSCYTMSFDYGQRHRAELDAAARVARDLGVIDHKVIGLNLDGIGGSALTDSSIDVPEAPSEGIPVTYVPARNTVFLSLALGWAEVLDAQDIFIGVNAVDYSGYPDCRPEFVEAFEVMANLATKAGVEGKPFSIKAPLQNLSKAQIVQAGIQLGVDYSLTVSCYQADDQGRACGKCDSCRLRADGFAAAGIKDPTRYF
jgi:7-cyano-7-deazaguanine synthase